MEIEGISNLEDVFVSLKTEKRKKETPQGGSEGLNRKDCRFDSDD